MPAWLAPAISAAASVIGGFGQSSSARAEAERNRRFQERMSSTAAQRSVEDYRAAGLNPALAYDRPASSPGGSQAQVEDVVGKGVSAALAAKQLQAQLKLTEAQTRKVDAEAALVNTDVGVRTTTTGDEPTWHAEQIAKRIATLRDLAHQGALQPHDERLRALAVLMARAQLAGADFKAETFGDVDAVRDFIKTGLSSAGDAAAAFKAWMGAGQSTATGENMRLKARIFRPGGPKDRFGILKSWRDQ